MNLTISNIQRKTNRNQEPMITFYVNVHHRDKVILTSKGWIAGVKGTVQPPRPYGFGGRKLSIFEVDGEWARDVRKLLESSAEIRAHLGNVAPEPEDDSMVTDIGVKGVVAI